MADRDEAEEWSWADPELAELVRKTRDPEDLASLVRPRPAPPDPARVGAPDPGDEAFARHVGARRRTVSMSVPPPRRPLRRERRTSLVGVFVGLSLIVAALGAALFAAGAAPRYIKDALDALPTFDLFPSPTPTSRPSPHPTVTPTDEPSLTPEPTPVPVRARTDYVLEVAPESVFVSEAKTDMCAAAAIQMTINILTGEPDRTKAFQRKIDARDKEFTTEADSKNGGWGAAGMAKAISAYSGVEYEVRIAKSRTAALRDAAQAIEATGQPVVLLVWRGAHAWVMTGFRSDADSLTFSDAKVSGAYILDPWYPRMPLGPLSHMI